MRAKPVNDRVFNLAAEVGPKNFRNRENGVLIVVGDLCHVTVGDRVFFWQWNEGDGDWVFKLEAPQALEKD